MKRLALLFSVLVFFSCLCATIPAMAEKDPVKDDSALLYAWRNANVRSGPNSERYDVVGTLKAADAVELIETIGQWSKVIYQGKVGYVYSKYFTKYETLAYRNHPIIKLLGSENVKKITIVSGTAEAGEAHYGYTLTNRWNEAHTADRFDCKKIICVELRGEYKEFYLTMAIYDDEESAQKKCAIIGSAEDMLDSPGYLFLSKENYIIRWSGTGGLIDYTSSQERFCHKIWNNLKKYVDSSESSICP